MSSENPYDPPAFSTESGAIGDPGEIQNVQADSGEILKDSFRVWKENLGILVMATLIVFGIMIAFIVFNSVVDVVLKGGFDRPPNASSFTVSILLSLTSNAVQLCIGIGHAKLMLALLRGQNASLTMLFGGAERFLPTLGVSILLSLGFLLCILPGIIIVILYWPAYFLVVDQRIPVLQSFAPARRITQGNEGTTIVTAFLVLGIVLVGVLCLGFGVILAQPLAMLLFPCAYLVMSGQLDLKRERSQVVG